VRGIAGLSLRQDVDVTTEVALSYMQGRIFTLMEAMQGKIS